MGDYFVWGGQLILMYNNERGVLQGWSIESEGGIETVQYNKGGILKGGDIKRKNKIGLVYLGEGY